VPPAVIEERSTTPAWSRGTYERRGWSGNYRGPGRRPPRGVVEEAEPVFDVEESQDAPRYVKGERVRHRKFGGGVVREVSGVGRNLKVTIEFDDTVVGSKQLLVAYAALEREWDGDGS
jgi:hypothetical protein